MKFQIKKRAERRIIKYLINLKSEPWGSILSKIYNIARNIKIHKLLVNFDKYFKNLPE